MLVLAMEFSKDALAGPVLTDLTSGGAQAGGRPAGPTGRRHRGGGRSSSRHRWRRDEVAPSKRNSDARRTTR